MVLLVLLVSRVVVSFGGGSCVDEGRLVSFPGRRMEGSEALKIRRVSE